MSSKIAERIAKILNQAENASTEAEAKVFMDKAQSMATEYSIDLAKARHITASKERTMPIVRFVKLGEPRQRGLNTYVALISGIADANNLKMTICHDSTGVHLYGFEEDIDITEALFASLLTQMVVATEAFKKEGSWKKDTVWRSGRYMYEDAYGKLFSSYRRGCYDVWVPGEEVPVKWLSARLDFQNAFARRVGTRLQLAALDAEQAAEVEEILLDQAEAGTALVLANKAVEVADFYKQNNNARGTYRGGRDNITSAQAHSAGRSAGDNARLSANIAIGAAKWAIA